MGFSIAFTWLLSQRNFEGTQANMKKLYDCLTESCQFSSGDQVLALMPLVVSPFKAKFTGPYTVERHVSGHNYLIATSTWRKSSQLCHVNLLEPCS